MSALGERLKRERKKYDLRRREVAEAIGVSESAMGMYECGARVPRDAIKTKLATFYGLSVGELFFGESCVTGVNQGR